MYALLLRAKLATVRRVAVAIPQSRSRMFAKHLARTSLTKQGSLLCAAKSGPIGRRSSVAEMERHAGKHCEWQARSAAPLMPVLTGVLRDAQRSSDAPETIEYGPTVFGDEMAVILH